MWYDLRYSVRSLLKQPLFAVTAILVLAIGIGLSAAAFSVLSALLFTPLPVPAPEELVYLYRTTSRTPDRPLPIGRRVLDQLREHNQAFSGLSGTWPMTLKVTSEGETELLHGEMVQSGYFDVLGIASPRGRLLHRADYEAHTEPVIVISHELWERRFGSEEAALGKVVRLSDALEQDFTIVGVAPRGFRGLVGRLTPSHFWVAAPTVERHVLDAPPGAGTAFVGLARLQRELTPGQARAFAEAHGRQFFPEQADVQQQLLLFPASEISTPTEPTRTFVPARVAVALTIVLTLVLLIAVSNIASIAMARGLSRTSEMAIRRALGASRRGLMRQLALEAMLLAIAGGISGLVVAGWLLAAFEALTPSNFPVHPSLDWRTVSMIGGASLLAGILVSLAPAVQAARLDIWRSLAGTASATLPRARQGLQRVLVLSQIIVSVALLLAASVYVPAQLNTEHGDLGYDPQGVAVLSAALRKAGGQGGGGPILTRGEHAREYYQRLLVNLESLPGVQAGIAANLPLHAAAPGALSTVSRLESGDADEYAAAVNRVSPGYFGAMGLRILAGRDFRTEDTPATPRVAIVSSALAERFWPSQSPIGRQVLLAPASGAKPGEFEVVGVVNDVEPVLGGPGDPYVYLALGQAVMLGEHFVVARGGETASTFRTVREAILRADPYGDPFRSRSLNEMVAEIRYPRRVATGVLLVSAALALLLASVGLYGVVAYSVNQRLGEIGIRRALGAGRRDIARLVMTEGLKVVSLGSILGLALGYAAVRTVSHRVLAMPAVDIAAVIAMPLVMAIVVLLACAVPVRRAASVDPVEVLRR